MFSGKNGSLIKQVNGDAKGDIFGASVAGLGDLNNDGYPEFIVGATRTNLIGYKGYARIFSGKDFKSLAKFEGVKLGDYFGSAVASAGDVNGDKVPDVLIGASEVNSGGPGYVVLLSGKTGALLWTYGGAKSGDKFGASIMGGADIDKDGTPDFIVGAPGTNASGVGSGRAIVFSGKTKLPIWTVNGDSTGDAFGTSVALGGDVDGDGWQDFIVGAIGDNGSGSARVFSGKTGKSIYFANGDSAGDAFGSSVALLGDINLDGFADFAAGAPHDDNVAQSSGLARVFSGKSLSLSTDVHDLSLKAAGTQTLSLDAGTSHGGRYYQLFGSASGTAPGLKLMGIHIPLNVDAYTDFAMMTVNSKLLANFRGQLDSKGQATATFNVPANLPSTADTTLTHAYLVFDGKGAIYFASNAATLRLEN